jgi:hypothetical protein
MLIRPDVMVVAARAATAILLARLGRDVVLPDPAHPPDDTLHVPDRPHRNGRTSAAACWIQCRRAARQHRPGRMSRSCSVQAGEPRIGDAAGAGGMTRFPAWPVIHSRHWMMQIPCLARHCRVVTARRAQWPLRSPGSRHQRGHQGTPRQARLTGPRT